MLAITSRLDDYWAEELGCAPDALYRGGMTVCAPAHREAPRWMGWMVPLESVVVNTAEPGTGVISIAPSMLDALHRALPTGASPQEYLPPHGQRTVRFARDHFPNGYPKVHCILYCEEGVLRPAPENFPVTRLDDDDIHADWFRLHFDGPIFVARNPKGSIAAWAAIKCKSPEVWEMAVATEPPYRNRGLAKSVVSKATQAALAAGKVPLYLHEISNIASARVCGALGYRLYGYELTCECGRVTTRRT
jgi:GNAT superfamily N-acetyltransferase